jgi:hypothetical protein
MAARREYWQGGLGFAAGWLAVVVAGGGLAAPAAAQSAPAPAQNASVQAQNAPAPAQGAQAIISIDPAKMARLGTVDERFQSYNIEMVEVTGGRFWKPYKNRASEAQAAAPAGGAPAGLDPNLFEYRAPIDLINPRLRKLAAALGPAYVRVSGTWANTVYFQDSDEPAPAKAPEGFNAVLTRKEWKGVIDFSKAAKAELVTSFAFSQGTRDSSGVWTAGQASKLLAYTKSAGGKIAAAEFMNEPTYAAIGGAPKGYDAAAYARDLAVFRPFFKKEEPGALLMGPGSVGEGLWLMPPGRGMIKSEDIMQATGPVFDMFSYHLYAAVSQRCAPAGPPMGTTPAAALTAEWLALPEKIAAFYAGLRDRFEPGKPLWITETADAACGGDPWAATFLDSFRYLVQHGSLAQRGVSVIMHNTLAASDYGLLDEKTYEPRPNYWAALEWRRLMGTTVLKPEVAAAPNVYVYAHCLRGHAGGVALLVVNADREHAFDGAVPMESIRSTLTASDLESSSVELNGKTLELDKNDDLPEMNGEPARAGQMSFAPESITFLAIAKAGNASCR